MAGQTVSEAGGLEKLSVISGILSFGLVLFPLWIFIQESLYDIIEHADLSVAIWIILGGLLMLGSLVTGILGCLTAIITLRRIRGEAEDNTIKRRATLGFILSILSIATTLFISLNEPYKWYLT